MGVKRSTYRINKDGWWALADILREPKEFNPDSASLRGRFVSEYDTDTGIMPEGSANALRTLIRNDEVEYIVYSYRTPIAWKRVNGGGWGHLEHKYSVTTSKHQGNVFTAISQINGD